MREKLKSIIDKAKRDPLTSTVCYTCFREVYEMPIPRDPETWAKEVVKTLKAFREAYEARYEHTHKWAYKLLRLYLKAPKPRSEGVFDRMSSG